ncbi:hypothetical protein AMIS_43450 [Actinoplanes missouriensis 431]|uniref:Uncharacterized protein n=1 Tax=Actinoplanes missouriensis (strain ATCC 14538 / DSM 43046 / CBS 188.64 / JCM 3121 / NBRC 102363 / NCIMB 12654 / NRRL B-3342 / UNCC 431) TaxID=512565 RepID=I0H978_ACTM4|nr:hypothetical protein [Actinoplanes missouriensis]BAL89565.1 hypothetical protein AMIS_43450 [Actinoplanes missouriensis 431]
MRKALCVMSAIVLALAVPVPASASVTGSGCSGEIHAVAGV